VTIERRDVEDLVRIQRESYARAGAGLRSSWPKERALDADGFVELLTRRRYAVLATSRADGRAHAAPVGFVLADGALWIGTVEGLRLRNVRARPWASVVVIEGDAPGGEDPTPHRAMTAEGPVAVHEGERFASSLAAFAPRWAERYGRTPDWAAALLELRPERVFSYAAS
jgi:hypothetical protein